MEQEYCLRFNTEDEQAAKEAFTVGMAACGYEVYYSEEEARWIAPMGLGIDWVGKVPKPTTDLEAPIEFRPGIAVNVRWVVLDMQHFLLCDDVTEPADRYQRWF